MYQPTQPIPNLSLSELHSDITHLFIADLHLSEDYPRLVSAFHQLLDTLSDSSVKHLYILGDWFNAWVGDDYIDDPDADWLRDIVQQLQQLNQQGITIYFCHGNRDFGIAKPFLSLFNGELLSPISYFQHNNLNYRLEHGDFLCTDDKAYQRFRKIIRNPVVLTLLNMQSLQKRKQIANNLREKSKQANKHKSQYIMDVNHEAVLSACKKVDVLIHGHTHRPDIHQPTTKSTRFVLGDWREQNNHVSAIVGIIKHDFSLVNLSFSV